MLFEDGVTPTGYHDTIERDLFLLREVRPLGTKVLFHYREGLNDRLKAILAPKGQMFEDEGQHLPIVVAVLLPHDIVVPDAVLGPTGFGLRRQITERLLLHPGKQDVPDRPFGLVYHRFRHSKQQLDLPGDPFDVPAQFLLEMFVGLGVDPADNLQHHADHVVNDVHRALVNEAR